MRLKTKSKELSLIWEELQDIFYDFKIPLSLERLTRLGFKVVYVGKHPKLYIRRHNRTFVITLSSTGEKNAYRQTLRRIRRIYENE